MKHGVYVGEQATSAGTPSVVQVGIPFAVGTAPVQSAAEPAKVGIPVLCESWEDAVKKLGYSDDWEKYSLCEVMYTHFKLYGRQPLVLCNVLDPAETSAVAAADIDVADHKAKLPIEAVRNTIKVLSAAGNALAEDTDYGVYTDGEHVVVELIATSAAYADAKLNIAYSKVTGDVVADDVAKGFEAVELCLTTLGVTPDLLIAPGWSHEPTVAAVMATKAAAVNGLFHAKAIVDVNTNAAKTYTAAVTQKGTDNLVDEDIIAVWPMLTYEGRKYHYSAQLAGAMARLDADNGGIPYESPSNKALHCDGLCLDDGTEVLLTLAQANALNAGGIVTAINFVNGWCVWGNYCSCYPAVTEAKDSLISVSRMFGFVGNTVIRTFWNRLDQPVTRRLIDSILDACNIWLNGLVGSGYLYGGRVEMSESENSAERLAAGIIKLHVYLTPPGPVQEIDFVLEYDPSYITGALSA